MLCCYCYSCLLYSDVAVSPPLVNFDILSRRKVSIPSRKLFLDIIRNCFFFHSNPETWSRIRVFFVAKYHFLYFLRYHSLRPPNLKRCQIRSLLYFIREHSEQYYVNLNRLDVILLVTALLTNIIYSVKLGNPETLAAMQETRINQLEVAINMEMWQVATNSTIPFFLILSPCSGLICICDYKNV